jgi:serpin B
LPRSLSAGEEIAIRANNQFAFDLLEKAVLGEPGRNAFLSPLSVSLAIGMVMNGARGSTRDSMAVALGFGTTPQSEINASYESLIRLLRGLDQHVEFTIANSIWTERTYPVNPTFLTDARRFFDAEAQALDFSNVAAALAAINGWVDQKTRGKIPTILDDIADNAVLYAVNAIYFKGSWREQFKKTATAPAVFHAADGTSQTVPFMHRTEESPYYGGPDFEAVDLWYGAGAHTMTLVLPRPGASAAELAAGLGSGAFEAVASGLRPVEVDLALPKLTLEYRRSLKDDLTALGMGIAFDPTRADLGGIATAGRPYITRVEHKTYVDINEEGTEAAAATSVEVGVTSAPQRVSLRFDRPFLIAIRERLSGTILFLGVISSIPNPSR